MSATQKLLRFGVFESNLATEELRQSGTLIKLPPQPFKLLVLLASHAGLIVTRDEIQKQLWGEETFVDFEHGVNKCIKQIRGALNDNADKPLYIETLPRHGYRFLAPVVAKTVMAPAPQVIKSASGVQSGIAPSILAKVSKPLEVPPSATGEAALRTPTAESPPARMKATSAEAAAEALSPEIERLRRSQAGGRRTVLVWAALIVILLLAAWLYWR